MASTIWRTRLQQVRPSVFGKSKPPWTSNHYLRTRNYDNAAYNPFLVDKTTRKALIVDKARRYMEEQAIKKGGAGQENRMQARNRMHDFFGNLSPSATNLYHDVSSGKVDAAHFLQESSLEGKDLLEVIRACLHGEESRLFALKRKIRRAAMREKLASVILDLIWGRDDLWKPLILHDDTARTSLAYLAVAEGLTDLLIQWLQVHDDSNGWGSDREQALWRAFLWRSIINAHLMLNEDRSADNAIRCFFEIYDLRKEHIAMLDEAKEEKSDYFALMSAEPSCVVLDRELSSDFYQNTDPALYDRYIKFRVKAVVKNPAMYEFNQAALHLVHPRDPSAGLAYNFFRKRCEGETSESIAKAMQTVSVNRNRLEQILKRTRSLLDGAGRREEAAYIKRMTASIVASKDPRRQPAEYDIV